MRELKALGDLRAAVEFYDRAIAIYERLVHQEGRRELRGDLAWVQAYRASLLPDPRERSKQARQAVAILKEEVQRTGRMDLKRGLDWAIKAFEGAR